MPLFRTPLAALACLAAFQSAQAQNPFLDRETITTAFPMPNTPNFDFVDGTVGCPAEAVLITGGATILSSNNGIPPFIALMATKPEGNGWFARAREINDNDPTMSANLLVTAVCGYTHRSSNPHIQVVSSTVGLNRSSGNLDFVDATVACPAGKTVISGGASVSSSNGLIPQSVVLMTSMVSGNGWTARAREVAEAPSSAQLTVRAVCADAGSGISAQEVVATTASMTSTANMDLVQGSATCPAGKTRLGGGAHIISSNGGIPPQMTLMTSEASGSDGWTALGRETQHVDRGALTVNMDISANCAALAPEVTGLQIVSVTKTMPNGAGVMDAATVTAYCPVGKTLIGGGARILSSNNAIPPYMALLASAPASNGWKVVARETTDTDRSLGVNVTATAVCAILPP
jgi:hypothetical protein